jgi:Tol biopolymer transport system component
MVTSRRLFDRIGFLDRVAPALPIVSAVIVVLLGFGLTWGAYARAKGNVHFVVPVQMSVDEARILYLAEDGEKVKRLYITDSQKESSRAITEPVHDVIEYALSPDQLSVAYVVLTDDLENQIRLGNVEGMGNKILSDCADAICSGLVWSPDGRRIIYERLSLEANSSGLPTLWWIDVTNGGEMPVFQEASLPGGKPRWSPNGEWLSYSTPQGVRLYHLESGETRTLENVLGAAALWSPDSRSILLRDVVIQNNQFVTQLFLYNLEAGTTVNLNPSEGFENLLAAWSPTGEFIAVVRRDLSIPRGDQVWLMRADGSGAHVITDTPDVLHGSLSWSPDGRYLLFDLYMLDAYPSVSRLQIIGIDLGEVISLDFQGYSPVWVWR